MSWRIDILRNRDAMWVRRDVMVILNGDEGLIMDCLVKRVTKGTGEPHGIECTEIVAETKLSMAEINRACAGLQAKGLVSVATEKGNVDAIYPIHPNGYKYLSMRVFGHE